MTGWEVRVVGHGSEGRGSRVVGQGTVRSGARAGDNLVVFWGSRWESKVQYDGGGLEILGSGTV